MELISTFFNKEDPLWKDVIGVCTDGAAVMLGSRSGFLALVKLENPTVTGIQCMIHRKVVVSKTLPSALHVYLKDNHKNSQYQQRARPKYATFP